MNWDEAKKWAEKANEDKDQGFPEPRWSWDCGLKLDFDGGLLSVSSRFYCNGGYIFSGRVSFLIGEDTVYSREFGTRHIDVLKGDVEKYVKAVTANIDRLLKDNIVTFINKNEKF